MLVVLLSRWLNVRRRERTPSPPPPLSAASASLGGNEGEEEAELVYIYHDTQPSTSSECSSEIVVKRPAFVRASSKTTTRSSCYNTPASSPVERAPLATFDAAAELYDDSFYDTRSALNFDIFDVNRAGAAAEDEKEEPARDEPTPTPAQISMSADVHKKSASSVCAPTRGLVRTPLVADAYSFAVADCEASLRDDSDDAKAEKRYAATMRNVPAGERTSLSCNVHEALEEECSAELRFSSERESPQACSLSTPLKPSETCFVTLPYVPTMIAIPRAGVSLPVLSSEASTSSESGASAKSSSSNFDQSDERGSPV